MPSKREALRSIGKQSVDAMQRSNWPVDTGRSKRGFRFSVAGDSVQMTNAEEYAQYVEERTGITADTLSKVQYDGDEVAQWLESQL